MLLPKCNTLSNGLLIAREQRERERDKYGELTNRTNRENKLTLGQPAAVMEIVRRPPVV